MKYTKVTYTLSPRVQEAADVMQAQLGEVGFDSFADTETGFEAYIPSDIFSPELPAAAHPVVGGVTFGYTVEDMPDKDWNEIWERNSFKPFSIAGGGKTFRIRGPFHPEFESIRPPEEREVIISPRMAFGTGAHATTRLTLRLAMETVSDADTVLDVGCGTGILSIAASLLGAKTVDAIDIDDWCVENTFENIRLNGIANVRVRKGGAELLTEPGKYTVVLANINKNTILRYMDSYVFALKPDCPLIISGFYTEDLPQIEDEFLRRHNKKAVRTIAEDNWAAALIR